ncbi:MAG: hypothetical protein E6Q97_15210 [Desulfurellales bacterium]|nr:MAG: hypothetical protein E6Q97_15210 [Desulfurellales bacterium]
MVAQYHNGKFVEFHEFHVVEYEAYNPDAQEISMAKLVEDGGCVAIITKPARLPVFDQNRVPDAVTCSGAAIIINDSRDGNPRPHLAVSNGASWDQYVRADEVESIVTALVSAQLKSLIPATVDVVLPAPQLASSQMTAVSDDDRFRVMAQAMLEMSEQIVRLQHAVADHSRVIDGALIPVPAGAAA